MRAPWARLERVSATNCVAARPFAARSSAAIAITAQRALDALNAVVLDPIQVGLVLGRDTGQPGYS
jgi:hypothetical protein